MRRRKWSLFDLQYLANAAYFFASLALLPIVIPLKVLMVASAVVVLLIPATSQFFVPSFPIWTYVLYFFACG